MQFWLAEYFLNVQCLPAFVFFGGYRVPADCNFCWFCC